ncbi:MAG: hypothetical protein ACJ763_18140 [Bdellovibrionia bacterium]
MQKAYRFFTVAVLAILSNVPQSYSSDSPCFSEKSCAASTLSNHSNGVLEKGCEVTRAAACADIKDSEKLYSCDMKSFCERTSLDAAIARTKGCSLGAWNATGKAIWDVLKGIYAFATHSSTCNSDIEQKLDMIDQFNDALPPGESFKTPPTQSLERMSCSDLLKEFNTKAYNVTQRMTEKSAADVSKEINPVKRDLKKTVDLKAAAGKLLDELKVKRECYNTEALAEMYCEAGTVAALTAAGPAIAAFRVARLNRLVELSKSVQVEAAASKLAKAGDAIMPTAGGLSNADRKGVAEFLLGRTLSKAEKDALIAAHEVGKDTGAGFMTYTPEQLRDKARILRRAGFTSRERAILMRNGIAGSSADSAGIRASMSQTKTFKILPKYEQESRLKVFDLRDRLLREVDSQGYRFSSMTAAEKREYLRNVRGLAEANRVAGESAASVGDLTSGQALTKDALSQYDRVLKNAPDMLASQRDREALLGMRIRAGDTEGAAKMFVENAKTDFEASGFRNANEALNENFQALRAQAEAGPSRSVLNNERGTEVSLVTRRPIAATNASSAYVNQMQELKTLDKILESKPAGLVNIDYVRERSRIQSLLEGVKRELRNRGYNPDQF